MQLLGKTSIDFLGKRHLAYVLSAILIALSVYAWVSRGDGKYDIDFTGGLEFIIDAPADATSDAIRTALDGAGIVGATVQSFEVGTQQYSVKIGAHQEDAQAIKEKFKALIASSFSSAKITQEEFVGPTVGSELKKNAVIAIVLALVGIVLYVTYRFEFAFALGALVALAHDVIVATGGYLLAGHDLNMGTVAAALTIIGYSVNDTIVIFDKVREEIFKRQSFDLVEIMNECMNAMLSRTVITSALTLFSALALYTLGGGAIADLSLFLTIGLVCGVYSTVFIAAPIVVAWDNYTQSKK
jgi:preprotein translocase subunit SecF